MNKSQSPVSGHDKLLTTEYAVQMTCETCANSVRNALQALPGKGFLSVTIDIAKNQVVVKATDAPSAVFKALKSTKLPTIVRGIGLPGLSHSAVVIFEASNIAHDPSHPFGMARVVQLHSDQPSCLVDLTMSHLPPGDYQLDITETGDISQNCNNMMLDNIIANIGTFTVDQSGHAQLENECKVNVWDVVGRGMLIRKLNPTNHLIKSDDKQCPMITSLCGIIARSGGVFENNKVICSCSGKTLWEEQMGWLNGNTG